MITLRLAPRARARIELTLAFVALTCGLVVAVSLPAPRAERSTNGEEELLPINETPAERAFARLQPLAIRASDPPPMGPIRNVAEFEQCTGVLIRYPLGIEFPIIREMAEDVTIHVIVNSANYLAALNNFLVESIDTSRVEFIVEPNNSIWTRDYGPWFIFDGNGDQVIVDHFYNRTARPDDDAIPIALGARWGIPVVTHDLWHAGGNYLTEGHGRSFSSNLVWDENWPDTPAEIAARFADYYGVVNYNVLPDISDDGIHHIDTWGMLLDEETILMKQVSPLHPDYARVEANVASVAGLVNGYGRPFRVVRVFCPTITAGDVAAYTNAFILNKKVFVPTFNVPSSDALALQVFRDNMPGYEVLGFGGGWLSDDAIHCRVIGIHDRYMLRVDHDPIQGAAAGIPIPVTMYADDRSETGINTTLLYWRVAGSPTFSVKSFNAGIGKDWYRSQIPAQQPGTHIEYFVMASDFTGRAATRPRTAPLALYKVTVDSYTAARPANAPKLTLSVTPSPFQYRSTVRFNLGTPGPARVVVYDVRGREVARLLDGTLASGAHEVEWTGRSTNGVEAPSGVYFVVLNGAGERMTRRVVLLR